jgi:hypothetical protein
MLMWHSRPGCATPCMGRRYPSVAPDVDLVYVPLRDRGPRLARFWLDGVAGRPLR